MESLVNERCLTFKYGRCEETSSWAEKLSKLLEENNIDYVCYGKDDSYYPCQFFIRRCGKKWNDIYNLINSVKATKYDFKKIDFYLTDRERDVLGNIQEVCIH